MSVVDKILDDLDIPMVDDAPLKLKSSVVVNTCYAVIEVAQTRDEYLDGAIHRPIDGRSPDIRVLYKQMAYSLGVEQGYPSVANYTVISTIANAAHRGEERSVKIWTLVRSSTRSQLMKPEVLESVLTKRLAIFREVGLLDLLDLGICCSYIEQLFEVLTRISSYSIRDDKSNIPLLFFGIEDTIQIALYVMEDIYGSGNPKRGIRLLANKIHAALIKKGTI